MPITMSEVHATTLVHLADHIDKTGAWPSLRESTRREGITTGAMRARLSTLNHLGMLVRLRMGARLTKLGERVVEALRTNKTEGLLTIVPAGPQPSDVPSIQVRRYLARWHAGEPVSKIAKRYGKTPQAISDALTRWLPRVLAREDRFEALRSARR